MTVVFHQSSSQCRLDIGTVCALVDDPSKTEKTFSSFLLSPFKSLPFIFQKTFSRSLIKGCYFHLSQNVKKKAYELGLKWEYDGDIDLRMKIRSLISLALIPPEDVFDLLEFVTAQFLNNNRFERLSDYFEGTYIRSRNGNSGMFPLSFSLSGIITILL